MTIRVLLNGGLGNNLFQVNQALNLAEQHSSVKLVYLSSRLDTALRTFSHASPHFSIKALQDIAIDQLLPIKKLSSLSSLFALIACKVDSQLFACDYRDQAIPLTSTLKLKLVKGSFLTGCSINLCLVNHLRKSLGISKSSQTNEIALHYRSGDFLVQDILSHPYYLKALAFFPWLPIRVYTTDRHEFMCSIQPSLHRREIIFSDATTSIGDFRSIANSKYIVSSNSTFSWWASEISYSSIIVEPHKFYQDSSFGPISSQVRIKI